jgi:hypothetical protein
MTTITAHILVEIEVDDGTPAGDVAAVLVAAGERAVRAVRGDGFRAVTFSTATTATPRAALLDGLRAMAAREVLT